MNKLKAHLNNIAFSHSVFALPFAFMGAILAVGKIPSGHDLFWITVAMVGARSAALALNNFIDLKYDKLHPRFTKRPMVTGAVKPVDAALFIFFSLAVFFIAALNLNPLCLKLFPLAIIPMAIYPYMKRFSWACHLILGLALSVAPIGAWIAIRGDMPLPIVLLGLAVAVWIGGFDAIYGCQDVEFDKKHNLHSMPVRFGVQGALTLSKFMHMISIVCFLIVGYLLSMHAVYYLGVLLAAGVLVYQHAIVSPGNLSKVTQAYFMRNGLVSIALLIFTVVSIVL